MHLPAGLSFEVIALLNSEADYDAILGECRIDVRVIRSSVNLGLAGAGNRARAEARGEFLVLLHDDSQIEPGWIEALLDAAETNPHAGAIGGKVITLRGTLQSAGMILWRDAATSAPWLGSPPDPESFAEPRAVDYIGTSSLLIRAATWDAVGGLDEQFYPVYFVDVDLAMKIRRHGQIVLYEPRSRTRHHQGASGELHWRQFVSERNRRKFIQKWEAELAGHEARVPDSREAIDRAVRRAQAFAQSLVADDTLASGQRAGADASPFDRVDQERRALMMAVDLYRAYADALRNDVQSAEARMAAIRDEMAALRKVTATSESAPDVSHEELSRLRKRDSDLASIESLRWMRLYAVLQPMLRHIAKIIPR